MSEGERRRRRKDDDQTREKLKRKLSPSNQSNDNQCTICLNDIRDLSFADCCLHPFCRSCIIEWSKRSNHCPVCRTTFENVLTSVKSDSEYESIPIEPPPIAFLSIPLINIVRDIIVSQDGRSTVIRTRISNEEGVTEITETRGANEPTRTTTTTNHEGTRTGPDSAQPVTGPGPSANPTATEIEEIGRFMDVIFHSLLAPGQPFSVPALAENQTTLDPRLNPRRGHPRSRIPGPFYPPPMMLPPPGHRSFAERLPRNYQNLEWPRRGNRRDRGGIFRNPDRREPSDPNIAQIRPPSQTQSTSTSEDAQQNSQNEEPSSNTRPRRRRRKSDKDEPSKD